MSTIRAILLIAALLGQAAYAQEDWDNWTTHRIDGGCEVSAGIVLAHRAGETRFLIRFLFPPAVNETEPAGKRAMLIEALDRTLAKGEPMVVEVGAVQFNAAPSEAYPHEYRISSDEAGAVVEALRSSEYLKVTVLLASGQHLTLETVARHFIRHVNELGSCTSSDI